MKLLLHAIETFKADVVLVLGQVKRYSFSAAFSVYYIVPLLQMNSLKRDILFPLSS